MRDYQRKKNNKYILPNAVYHQTLWCIRDYYRMKERMDEILMESPAPPDGMPSDHNLSNEPQNKAEKRDPLFIKTQIIESSLTEIPEEYRKGVWENIQHGSGFPRTADRSTYGRWKSRYIYSVAVKMEFIDK